MRQVVLLSLLVVYVFSIAPLHRVAPDARVPSSFLVVFKDEISAERQTELKVSLLKMDTNHYIKNSYTVIPGFAAALTDEGVHYLRSLPEVSYVEEDQIFNVTYIRDTQQTCTSQTGAVWGLGRVTNYQGGTTYQYDVDGAGSYAYIIDTGVLLTHNEFQTSGSSRAFFGANYVTGESNTDLNGHGTHVAGTVGGNLYGIAKRVTLYGVKVLNAQGSGTTAGVISGIDWVNANHIKPATANMSLGGGTSPTLDAAVDRAVQQGGVFFAIAAGNSNANACNYSPARASESYTVMATGQGNARSSFSNFGTCCHIFAPGEGILSAWIGSNTATNSISGTSMATPHVCGVANIYRGKNTAWGVPLLKQTLSGNSGSIGNVIGNIGAGSPNRFLQSACNH